MVGEQAKPAAAQPSLPGQTVAAHLGEVVAGGLLTPLQRLEGIVAPALLAGGVPQLAALPGKWAAEDWEAIG